MATSTYSEIGSTGLNRFMGMIEEEADRELRGDRWVKKVIEMQNDPVIGAMLFAAEMLCRQVQWDVSPYSSETESLAIADFVKAAIFDDQSMTWQDNTSEILSMLPWGWYYPEIVWKQRLGQTPGSYRDEQGREQQLPQSKFDDGLIGIRKLAPRAQETRDKWEFDPAGGIQGMWQRSADMMNPVLIPIDKALLFRTTSRKNSPEGKSLLRAPWRPYFYKHHMEQVEAIGIERDLAGFPVARIPSEFMNATATADQKAVLAAYERIVTEIKRDEREGIVLPSDRDDQGGYLYALELLSSGGSRQIDPDKPIQRYNALIAGSMLADFMLLGHESVGSFALASSKTNLFCIALGAFLDVIKDIVNRHLIPRLLQLNGMDLKRAPTAVHDDVEQIDIAELGDYVSKLSGAGIEGVFTPEAQRYLLQRANIPVAEEDAQVPNDTGGDPPGGEGLVP
jgi:hypothetical protein